MGSFEQEARVYEAFRKLAQKTRLPVICAVQAPPGDRDPSPLPASDLIFVDGMYLLRKP